jgi:hypothetical protein
MEKRSDRHIRDLVAHTAFQGLAANEIGCARISMMAGSKTAPFKGPNTDEPDQLSPDRHLRLATHGRSIQMCQSRRKWRCAANAVMCQELNSWRVSPTEGSRSYFDDFDFFIVAAMAPERVLRVIGLDVLFN